MTIGESDSRHRADYAYSLALTSQFYFCSLPLRLDVEPTCQFSCLYCFAKARGGSARRSRARRFADPERLRRRLARADGGLGNGAVDEMLQRRTPIHMGGMSDPFGRTTESRTVTLRILDVLAEHHYPTIISTKGVGGLDDREFDVLRQGRFMVQFSLSTFNEPLAASIEIGTSTVRERLDTMRILASSGVPVSARLQPLLPGRLSDAFDLIDAAVDAGASYISAEHLKLPLEDGSAAIQRMSRHLGVDLRSFYRAESAERVGREWLLPVEYRVGPTLALRERVHGHRIPFGAADTDLLLLADGEACCSGADLLGFTGHHRYTYTEAVRRSDPDRIALAALADIWAPDGPISDSVNSHSRIAATNGRGADLSAYIRRNWNGRRNGPSPDAFWGVERTGEQDADGHAIYRLTPELRDLRASSRPA